MRPLARAAVAASLLLLAPPAPALGQAPAFDLSVSSIMRGPELVGEGPSSVRWSDDGAWIYFRWKPGGEPWHAERDLYRVPARGGAPEHLSEEAADSLAPLLAEGELSPDRRWRVVSSGGDLFLIERTGGAVTRLTETTEAEADPLFSRDGRAILFLQGDNVFRLHREGGRLEQLTDIRRGPPPAEDKEREGLAAYLERQQEELFEHIRRGAEERERREARREAREAAAIPRVYLGAEERVFGLHVEPGGRWAILQVGKPARDARATIVPDYVTPTGYTEPLEVRAKVGDVQSESRFGLLAIETGELAWLDLSPGVEAPPDSTAADSAAAARSGTPGPDLAAGAFLGWSPDGTRGLIGAVGFDFKDQWLHVLDARTGDITAIAHDHDEAWIGGPCSPWLQETCAGWLPDGRGVFFVSERDGYAHLYTTPADGGEARQLTRGAYEVFSVELAPGGERFYLHTSLGSPYERHFDHLPIGGGELARVTTPQGRHDAVASPDGRRLAVVHSRSNQPPELYVMENRRGAAMQRLTESPTAEWLSGPWIEPDIVEVPARDGARVPARIYRPGDVGAQPNGAAVIFVHGAGYLQNVHRGWSSYYREYMFHHLLASRGYTVLDLDYRGSAGYGRDWRTAIYRHMGGKDLTDQVDGARWLTEHEGVEPGRVGIYGGSYGGFITLMALFTEAESFGAGAALRSVTDWGHYNHWYTGRILNLPQDDDEAYRRSSPIYHAEGLEDPLLIAHGMVDVNVHFQDVVRLAQRLIELGKTDWEMALYPVEDHAFAEPTSWTDEYRRILELFEESLHRGAAAGGGR